MGTAFDWSLTSLLRRSPTLVQAWRRYDDGERRLTAHVTARMIGLAGLSPGFQVLDLATGRGEPALSAAAQVAPGGFVVGTDLSAEMLDFARVRGEAFSVVNLKLVQASAETLSGVPEARFDATLCRWGFMFFDRPGLAMDAARRRMAHGAVLVAALWAEPERVPWWSMPRAILGRHLPQAPMGQGVRGPFRYASTEVFTRELAEHGFEVDHEEEMHTLLVEAESPLGLVEWCLAFGLGEALQSQPEHVQRAWVADMIVEAERHRGSHGMYGLGGATRLVRARVK